MAEADVDGQLQVKLASNHGQHERGVFVTQSRRDFGYPPIDYPTHYSHGVTLICGGADDYVFLGELSKSLTNDLLTDKRQGKELENALIEAVNKNACAAINARIDTTISVGVSRDGRVEGIEIESQLIVSQSKFCVYV